jgi:hypothetical protein
MFSTAGALFVLETIWIWYCYGPWYRELLQHISTTLRQSNLLVQALDGRPIDRQRLSWLSRSCYNPPKHVPPVRSFQQLLRRFFEMYGLYAQSYGVKAYPAKNLYIDSVFYVLIVLAFAAMIGFERWLVHHHAHFSIVRMQLHMAIVWFVIYNFGWSKWPLRFALVEATAAILLDDAAEHDTPAGPAA